MPFAESLRAVDEAAERVDRLTHAIEQAVESHPLHALVDALRRSKGCSW